ncbi:uncharacterized protein A1O9_01406 [Exophiala aquamarina CBS 119918]|uniref:NmrA-like domain-containing protein n=1 Tax=Exophiala aquamarina CBS 119918 TaxID=1182545 RepID=A0A072PVQ6_9EURO|nr:uncharacterized protein A1O9_01406 [Exophiala aquamarina CBS 119918]KEF63428.1 hypothetical protein A1O9_01406 [Exophiala aquamarina CBS 119918]
MSGLLVVIGATGGQGKSVVEEALKRGTFQKIRGTTRNASSPNAQQLISLGVEMCEADMNDEQSLVRAFQGATNVFAMTDFYESFRKTDPWRAMNLEYQHGINLANAAAQTPTLRHYVWSTLPSAQRITKKKIFVAHFEAKARVDDYMKSTHPELCKKTTFLWLGFFNINFLRPTFAPVYSKVLNKYVLLLPTPPTTLFAMLSDHTINIGKYVAGIFDRPSHSLPGKYVIGAVETLPIADFTKKWGAAVGKEISFAQVTPEHYSSLFPGYGAEMHTMLQFWSEYGEQAWSGEDLVTAETLGIKDELVRLEQALQAMDWDWIV